MVTYLIRQLGNVFRRAFSWEKHVSADPVKQRSQRLNAARQAWKDDKREHEIDQWIDDAVGSKGAQLVSGDASNSVTGVRVLKMEPPEAERLMKEMPNVAVIADCILDIIRPVAATDSKSKKPGGPELWHLEAVGLSRLRRRMGKNVPTGQGVSICVLDTGIDETHPEFSSGAVQRGFYFDVARNIIGAQQGLSIDSDGHGTHVAGLICGRTVGVAPGAQVINGVMLPKGQGTLVGFVQALEWAAHRPEVSIINLSAGLRGYAPELHQVMEALIDIDILPVVAVGNEGRDKTRSPGNYREVLSVGAARRDGSSYRVANFSSSGTIVADSHMYGAPDLVAPGQQVWSSVKGGNYQAWDGSSMGAPIVAGLAAILKEKYPKMSIMDLVEALLSACEKLADHDVRQGHGLVKVPSRMFSQGNRGNPNAKHGNARPRMPRKAKTPGRKK